MILMYILHGYSKRDFQYYTLLAYYKTKRDTVKSVEVFDTHIATVMSN